MAVFHSRSAAETKKLGRRIALEVLRRKKKRIIALRGDLGSGKTAFAKGFFSELGIKRRISSPTFVLIKKFPLKFRDFKEAYHIDCYRIAKAKNLAEIGLRAALKNPSAIFLIEWADLAKNILPLLETEWMYFENGAKENERIITQTN